MVANNANLGRLPTLGLGKIRAEDFTDDSVNPFKIQENTQNWFKTNLIDNAGIAGHLNFF